MIEFAALAAALLTQSRVLLPSWLPAGKLRGHEFVVGNLAGEPGDSLSINVETGKWADFASGEKGGDLIALYAAIHRISQADAAKQLDDGRTVTPSNVKPEKEKRQVIVPVPGDVPPCKCVHYEYGKPSQVWEYHSASSELLGYVARYDPRSEEEREQVFKGRSKEIIPWTFAEKAGKRQWGMGQWADPRPLYGLEDLAARPDAPVLIVEGEKSADAARKIVSTKAAYVVVSWPCGAQAWKKAGWKVLAKRSVLLWPDADDTGIKCMDGIGRHLLRICPVVKMILPELQDGWDAADALKEGWDWQRLKEWAQPRTIVITEGGTHGAEQTAASGMVAQPAASGNAGSGHGSDGDRSGGTPGTSTLPVAGGNPSNGAEAAPTSKYGLWMAWNLDRVGNGDPAANLNNAVAILEHDPSLRRFVWYDSFLDRMLTGDPPREWKDYDDINLALYMQRAIGLTKISRDTVSQAVIAIAFRDVRNSVRDWLEALSWDNEPRMDHFFEDHFGAVGNAYTRAASRNFWLSMVARIYRPGCKVDNMIVLEGAQGVGKSNALQIIGGEWFAEQHESAANPKGFGEILQGKWIVEISEMDSFQRAELTRVKAVVTNRNDRFRGSYKHYAEDHPRQCVFVGTTNKDDWNRDDTGARRFWPIRCNGAIDVQAIAGQREQLFAEAVQRFKSGESWWQMPAEETRNEQRARFQEDPWQDFIARFLYEDKMGDSWLPRTTPRAPVTTSEILMQGLGFDSSSRIGRLDEMRVASCLRVLGWTKVVERVGGKPKKVWRPIESNSEVSDGF